MWRWLLGYRGLGRDPWPLLTCLTVLTMLERLKNWDKIYLLSKSFLHPNNSSLLVHYSFTRHSLFVMSSPTPWRFLTIHHIKALQRSPPWNLTLTARQAHSLASAIQAPIDLQYHKRENRVECLAARLMKRILSNHPFLDSNKRTRLLARGGFCGPNKSWRSTSHDMSASGHEEGHRHAVQASESGNDSGKSTREYSSLDEEMVKIIQGVTMSGTTVEALACLELLFSQSILTDNTSRFFPPNSREMPPYLTPSTKPVIPIGLSRLPARETPRSASDTRKHKDL